MVVNNPVGFGIKSRDNGIVIRKRLRWIRRVHRSTGATFGNTRQRWHYSTFVQIIGSEAVQWDQQQWRNIETKYSKIITKFVSKKQIKICNCEELTDFSNRIDNRERGNGVNDKAWTRNPSTRRKIKFRNFWGGGAYRHHSRIFTSEYQNSFIFFHKFRQKQLFLSDYILLPLRENPWPAQTWSPSNWATSVRRLHRWRWRGGVGGLTLMELLPILLDGALFPSSNGPVDRALL